jgi:predicted O-methyltransferase YrrM
MNNLESRFTPSREFCRNPEYWHSPDSEATEEEVSEFIGALVTLVQPEFVLETGTYRGHTTLEIGRALLRNGHGKGVSIENSPRPDVVYSNFTDIIIPVTLLTMNTMDYVPDQDIDLAFFDSWQEGRHLEFHRYRDFGRLKPGAIVAFHDTAPHHKVLPFIEGLEREGFIKALYFHTPRGLVVAQVVK